MKKGGPPPFAVRSRQSFLSWICWIRGGRPPHLGLAMHPGAHSRAHHPILAEAWDIIQVQDLLSVYLLE
jgi:hypothetical protein